jgi:hypothetical protein
MEIPTRDPYTVSISYETTNFANSIDFYTVTEGSNLITNVYWNYIMMPSYIEAFSVFQAEESLFVSKFPDPPSGQHRFNVSFLSFAS